MLLQRPQKGGHWQRKKRLLALLPRLLLLLLLLPSCMLPPKPRPVLLQLQACACDTTASLRR